MNRSESKYFYTATLMNQALIQLLEQKDLPYITVKEICQKAGVNRSTFYLHYENIADLLEETNEYILRQFLASFPLSPEQFFQRFSTATLEELVFLNQEFLTPYLQFVQAHKSIFRAAFQNPHCLNANTMMLRIQEDILFPVLDRFQVPKSAQKYWVAYYTSGIMAIVQTWLADNCSESVETIEKIIVDCTLPQAKSFAKPYGVAPK